MPSLLPTYTIETYTSPNSIPDSIWSAWRVNASNANVMLPHAEQYKSRTCVELPSSGLWISCTSTFPTPSVDFVLSCTSNHLGHYPIFIFTTLPPHEHTSEDVIDRLTSLATALLRSVPEKRVFSVFAPESIARIFASIWTDITGIGLDVSENPEYYSAKISYCTKLSFRPRSKSFLAGMQYELRQAREEDTLATAQLCYDFAVESPPFDLSKEDAIREASYMIKNRQLWVHEIRYHNQPAEIASIVAVTRNSSTMATITKVYTNPVWRGKGCAERLVRKVTKHLLKTKERVCLYVAHNNPAAAKVYHRVGFLGLGPGGEPVDGIDRWLELGFDRSKVELGHW
ncbi:hypothetical protein BDY19DRAFT_880874 [Irpex rosettiformis]|uniref:Uncharacterized protein n=1 Tax=Irpex rosettiformis TaxID=378272 RepID=A0ACB8UL25_9APHY|nr:hypothetical protein BDY19DRAFT_880874 [Irpex rosettiformis]